MYSDSVEHYIEEIRRILNEIYIEYKGFSEPSSYCRPVFRDRPSNVVADASDSSN